MNRKALYNLSYGLFVLTTKYGEKDNACIINTAIQAASDPNQISICVNKHNYTNELICSSKEFAVSVIDQTASFDLIKRFGFVSGREVEKFENFSNYKRLNSGIIYICESTNAYMSVKVEKIIDLGSHNMFIGSIEDMEVLSDKPSITYDYYMKNVKPKPEAKTSKEIIYRCKICGYEYKGESLPKEYICPLCKHPSEDFEKV